MLLYYGMSVELQATRGAFYLAVQPGRMAFSWHAILVTGHLACGPGIFGSLCIAESPHPPNSLLYFSLSLPSSLSCSLAGHMPKDNCSALCGLVGLFILASWPWLVGRQCHDSYRQPHNYTTQSVSHCKVALCNAWGPISCDLPRRRCNSIVGMALGGAESGDIQQLINHLSDCLSNW